MYGGRAVIRVRGIPFNATAQDLADVLHVAVRDVYIRVNTFGPKAGRPDGQAFVKFSNTRMADQCMDKFDGCDMGGRYLELFLSDEQEFNQLAEAGGVEGVGGGRQRGGQGGYGGQGERRQGHQATSWSARQPIRAPAPTARNVQAPYSRPVRAPYAQPARPERRQLPTPQSQTDGVVRIRGLPFSATNEDVAELFSQYGASDADVFMCLQGGRTDGQCLVRFADATIASEVVADCQRLEMGTRYLEIFHSSEEDLEDRLNRGLVDERAVAHKRPQAGGKFGYVRMRGLPFNASPWDVVDFLDRHSFRVREKDVMFEFRSDRRPTGQCFVKFDSEATAASAQRSLHEQHMGERYIEVFPSTEVEATRRR